MTLARWRDLGSRLLIFEGGQPDQISFPKTNVLDLSYPNRVFTADMKILNDPVQILQALQNAIARYRGGGIATFVRSLPAGDGVSGSLYTAVPADKDLESWAISAVDSKEDGERNEAAQALGNFPSGANVERLKRMLDDPAIININGTRQVYRVRQSAWESLTRMGVTVSKPVLEK